MPTTAIFEESSSEEEDEFLFEFIPFIREHKKEFALYSSIGFMVFSLIGLLFNLDQSEKAEITKEQWANQSWLPTDCRVEDVGIAYRGDCETEVQSRMRPYQFTECLGGKETKDNANRVENKWADTPAGECAAKGNRDWKEVVPEMERRLRITSVHKTCYDSYLPWALLRVKNMSAEEVDDDAVGDSIDALAVLDGEHRCAYEWGATLPSFTYDWIKVEDLLEPLKRGLEVHNAVPCWLLTTDTCVVAFSRPHGISKLDQDEDYAMWAGMWVCAVLAVVFLLVAAYLYADDYGYLTHVKNCNPGDYLKVSTDADDECATGSPVEEENAGRSEATGASRRTSKAGSERPIAASGSMPMAASGSMPMGRRQSNAGAMPWTSTLSYGRRASRGFGRTSLMRRESQNVTLSTTQASQLLQMASMPVKRESTRDSSVSSTVDHNGVPSTVDHNSMTGIVDHIGVSSVHVEAPPRLSTSSHSDRKSSR